jgi:hypothetical protein
MISGRQVTTSQAYSGQKALVPDNKGFPDSKVPLMTHRRGTHRSTRRQPFRSPVLLTAVVALVLILAVGAYTAYASGYKIGPFKSSTLVANSARVAHHLHARHRKHIRPHSSTSHTPAPVTTTSAPSSPSPNAQPTATVAPITPSPTLTTPTPSTGSSAPTAGTGCNGAPNTPGGPDPWGGCFPGPENTGVPADTNLVNVDIGSGYSPGYPLPSDNTGWEFSASDGYIVVTARDAVIDGISDSDGIWVPAGDSLTVEDSMTGLINDEGASLLVENSTVNGGAQIEYPTIGGDNVTVEDSNIYGGKDEVNCEGDSCTVENSWLHNNYSVPAAHQQGFLANGGSGYKLQHNSIYCTGGCTADISFLSDDDNVTVSNNLLVSSPDSAFCVYPGPNQSSQAGVNDVVWTDNVFQRGAAGKCATYGPVYGWYPSDGTGDVWTGNIWDNGQALPAP